MFALPLFKVFFFLKYLYLFIDIEKSSPKQCPGQNCARAENLPHVNTSAKQTQTAFLVRYFTFLKIEFKKIKRFFLDMSRISVVCVHVQQC